MKYNQAILKGALLVGACLAGTSGCSKPEPKKPVPKVFNLRVVMFVETGANLDIPFGNTGGCKLTQAQVEDLVDDLIGFGPSVSPGVTFNWDRTIHKLESDCMNNVNPLPPLHCNSACALSQPGHNCPRALDVVGWFAPNVVGQSPNGPASLRQTDLYVADKCTINIYFVGNTLLNWGYGAGWTLIPKLVPQNVPHFVVINDLALADPQAPAQYAELKARKVLIHEVVCHFIRGDASHPQVPSGCPLNLCTDKQVYDRCWSVGTQPTDMPTSIQSVVDNELSQYFQCGGPP